MQIFLFRSFCPDSAAAQLHKPLAVELSRVKEDWIHSPRDATVEWRIARCSAHTQRKVGLESFFPYPHLHAEDVEIGLQAI